MYTEELIAYLESFLTERRQQNNHRVLSERTRHFTVAIEDVYQLHNTSAVMRSCDVFGVQDVHVIEERNVRKIDREIAMGAQKWVDIYRYHSTKACVSSLKEKGYQIVATSPHGSNCVTLVDFDISKPAVFFFGKEDTGLSDYVLDQSDVQLKIPMFGFTESLNISVCAAIILQHVTQELRKSTTNWRLTPQEVLEKRYDWVCKVLKSHERIIKRYHDQKESDDA
ncbi:TrmH family RNA methyltransferase [Aquimarina agarilytica]|uniref:TrmH family RNA methyltransferase n=1 Tax=Aquimarina agarilytica TaxID=1087449 RepID=UPI0002890B17|nr:RNA methyltransferase [Aquimarina agarilytica]